ncbi:MAG: hypothetical protein SH818_10845 [Saprospiraceae bacterium]|nr:hypothetical protein [Saprospiraceae bacterium]
MAATTSLIGQKSLVRVIDIDDQLAEVVGDKDKLIQVIFNNSIGVFEVFHLLDE